ncbi:MAG: hypothetical protein HGB04_05015 [Chlorobiaceae bacterium]|nr:hypothetical protein [Chlorobiaceae bacterium]
MPDTTAATQTAIGSSVPDGVRGLAMAAPVVGMPALLHAVTGLIVGGIGLAPILLASGVVAKQFLPAGMSFGDIFQSISQTPARKPATTASETPKEEQKPAEGSSC